MSRTPRIPILHATLIASLLLAAGGADGADRNAGRSADQAAEAIRRPAGRPALAAGEGHLAKVSGHLLRARALAAEGLSEAEVAAAVPAARLRDRLARVEVSLESLTPELLERLAAAGLVVDGFHFGYARATGRVDPADLGRLAAVAEVATIYPLPRRGTRQEGSVGNQADVTMKTDDLRMPPFSVDGTGVRVGVLSDSFRDVSPGTVSGMGCARKVTDTASQTSGDLPNSPGDVISLDDGPGAGLDEGRAIAELVYDVAPGAEFLFHSAFNDSVDFADGITELAACGADLIVDDVFYTREPFFQNGVIAQAAQAAFDAGVPYFSAAGNDATFGVHDVYVDSNPAADNLDATPSGDDLHDFGGGDRFAAITLPKDCSVYAELQWSEPFDGMLGPGAASDLDLYVLESAAAPASTGGANVLESSVTFTGCGATPTGDCADGICGDPVEIVEYTNTTGASDTVFLAVEHFCGSEDLDLRIVTISFDCSTIGAGWDFEDGGAGESPIFVDSQIFGHPAAEGVIAVAAAFFGEIDSSGTAEGDPGQLDVELFTSLGGGLPFYFDGAGNPLGSLGPPPPPGGLGTRVIPFPPFPRFKPDVTGPDGTSTTVPAFTSFFGTSAAAPNALALAVLIWQLTGELISPEALHQLIEQAVIDMLGTDLPGTDALSGTGFVDGLAAASSLTTGVTPLISDLAFDLDGQHFLTSPPTPLQKLQAQSTLTVGDGNYDGIDGCADQIIFTDGFESGDTSAWSSNPP